MKAQNQILAILLTATFVLLTCNLQAQEQIRYTGDWTGMFMDDFKTVIQLKWSEEKGFTGYIMMFDGDSQIQDDELSRIAVEEDTLTFFIKAKETSFEGKFDKEKSELSGKFTFPDGSRHPLVVRKEVVSVPDQV